MSDNSQDYAQKPQQDYMYVCPASPEKEDQRAAGSPAASTQLTLCLRLAIDLKDRKLATRHNPR